MVFLSVLFLPSTSGCDLASPEQQKKVFNSRAAGLETPGSGESNTEDDGFGHDDVIDDVIDDDVEDVVENDPGEGNDMTQEDPGSDFPETKVLSSDDRYVVTTAELEMTESGFLWCRARQEGLDVKIELWGPNEELVREVDSPSGPYGLEELAVVLPAGRYRVDVTSKHAPEGDAQVWVEGPETRPAGEPERRWAQAAEWVLEGRQAVKDKDPKALSLLQKGAELAGREGLIYWQAYATEQWAVALRRAEDHQQALARFEEAASWFRLLPSEDRRQANNRQNAAVLLLEMGRVDEAMIHLQVAWPIFERQKHHRGMALNLLRLGPAHLAKGHFQLALDHLHRAAKAIEQLTSPGGLDQILHVETGWALLALARPQDALDAFRKAIEAIANSDSESSLRNLLVARSGVAGAALQMGELDRAAEAIEAALAMDPPAGTNPVGLLLARGNLKRQQGLEEEAKADLETARSLAESLDDPKALADVLLSLGYIEIQTGRPSAALPLLEQAHHLYDGIGHLSGSASSRARLAEALKAMKKPEEAWVALKGALRDVETLRRSSDRRDHRLAFFASFRQDYFVMARDILLELGDLPQAFQVDESRRARELLDSLRYKGRSTPELRRLGEQEEQLERELRELAAQGGAEASPAALRALMDEIHRLRAERDRQLRERSSQAPLDLTTLQQDLDPSTVLLAFSLSDPHSLVWVVTRDSLDVVELASGQEVQEAVSVFKSGILNLTRSGQAKSVARSKALSEMLLAPVPKLSDYSRWVVVGEAELQQLPFAALPVPGTEVEAIENHELVYFPSVSALMQLRSQSRPRSSAPRIAAFVDPVFGPNDERLSGSPSQAPVKPSIDSLANSVSESRMLPRGVSLDRLPRSADEGRYLLSLKPDMQHLLASGFSANRASFEALDGSKYNILHLATHALVHDHPEMSALVLSLVDPQGNPVDGLLPALEISRRNLPLDLVVLSACETGLGQSVRGEGALSLAWSFLDAGSARVVSSLWSVDDRLTAELMKIFYREQLVNGRSPAAALRLAQLAMKAKPDATFYSWAGFILQGDWG